MVTLLGKLFNKSDDRERWGLICSVLGICLNILLFIGKYSAGIAACAVSVTADAFNNLSDAGSYIITLLGFKLAGKKPDEGHPFGHGRIEYMSGFAVSVLIILMAFELGKGSVEKILSPAPTNPDILTLVILSVSILIKLYMFFYNRRVGKRINSLALQATAADSISDAASTTAVLIAAVIGRFTSLDLDGWAGLLVSLFILYTGVSTARDTIGTLLGTPPSPEFVEKIRSITMSHGVVQGIHDLVVHDYGPGRRFLSLHAEVPDTGEINELHDAIDNIERELNEKLGCETVIHMDPISCDDSEVSRICSEVHELVTQIDPRLMIHDFRMVTGSTHTNLIFDVVVPVRFKMSDEAVRDEIQSSVCEKFADSNYYTVIKVDHMFT